MAHCDAVGWSRPHHQVDPRQRRRQLPQVGRRGTDDAGQLAERPMRGRDRFMRFRKDQEKPLGAVTRGLDPDIRRLYHPAAAAFRPALHIGPEIVERQIPLVIGTVEPFGRHPPVPLTPAHINLPATSTCRRDRVQNFNNAHRLSPETGAGSHSPSPQPVTGKPARLFLLGRGAGVRKQDNRGIRALGLQTRAIVRLEVRMPRTTQPTYLPRPAGSRSNPVPASSV